MSRRTRMPSVAQRLAVVGILALGLAGPRSAGADPVKPPPERFLVCNMKGTWVEANEDWLFAASYVDKVGPDTFTGVYSNPSAKTTATVIGAANAGAWTIKFAYTDAAHAGWVRELTGRGTKDPTTHELVINGSFLLKKSGAPSGNGTFKLHGTCHPK